VQSCIASGVPPGSFQKDHRDVPLPFDGTYWSISHKPRFVAAVISENPVGIDLEEILPRSESLFAAAAEEAEWILGGGRNWETFFRYWTAKEAVLKACGTGLRDLKQVRINAVLDTHRLLVEYADRLWAVQQYRFHNHIASITHDGTLVWRLLEEHLGPAT
jgi:4'-phosphopantetheinyl transferase